MIVCQVHCTVLLGKFPSIIKNWKSKQLFSYLALTSKVNEFDIMDAHADKCRNFLKLYGILINNGFTSNSDLQYTFIAV